MAYKTDLQSNNTDLQSILDMILALGLVDEPKPYLTFKSDSPITMYVLKPGWDGTMYYSLDAKDWHEWNGSSISANTIYVRGKENTKVATTDYDEATYEFYPNRWTITGSNISCEGNIETLLDYEIVSSGKHPIMADYCYTGLFSECSSLTSAPSLPATILTSYCYYAMFQSCTNLTSAPSLPATTLAGDCYGNMFATCSKLTSAPSLPATTLADYCYDSMFQSCTSLTSAPSLPATKLAKMCYYSMFSLCSNLTSAPSLPATALAEDCYKSMFSSCKSLISVPSLPATTLAVGCYEKMFQNCSKIKLSTTQTTEYTKPYRVPTSGTGTTAEDSLYRMFYKTGGTFTGTPSINTTYYLHESNSIV